MKFTDIYKTLQDELESYRPEWCDIMEWNDVLNRTARKLVPPQIPGQGLFRWTAPMTDELWEQAQAMDNSSL